VLISRRAFLTTLSALPMAAARPLQAATLYPRVLRLRHLHTGERLTVDYVAGNDYVPDALRAVDHFLRDFRTGEVHAIDPALLDLLCRLSALTESTRPYEVISGFRSPATNEMLRQRAEGVAASSLHMVGQAIDVRQPDVALASLRSGALSLHAGGVGYYPASNFVHVDTGRVRSW
jgi:uncharacterized protein YcbK (DUF882 family)